jgi:hypothetical protein
VCLQRFSWIIYRPNSRHPNWTCSLLHSSRSLRFGFVMFASEQKAEEAIRSLSGIQLNGCSVRLSHKSTADMQAKVV